MRVRTFPAKSLPAAALIIITAVLLTSACGGDATPAGAATSLPSPTATVQATLAAATPSSPPPTAPDLTPTPAITPLPPVIPTAMPAVLAPPTPTVAPEPTATPVPEPVLQSSALQLEVTFPPEDMVVESETITVTGLTSPDATVSINGNLAIPGADGRFSLELTISPHENPLVIEVIATSVAGEELSLVRTVIFVP